MQICLSISTTEPVEATTGMSWYWEGWRKLDAYL